MDDKDVAKFAQELVKIAWQKESGTRPPFFLEMPEIAEKAVVQARELQKALREPEQD